jgi:hypothetical protein
VVETVSCRCGQFKSFALLLQAVRLVDEQFDSLGPELEGVFGGSPLAEPFRESRALIVLSHSDHIVGWGKIK